MAWYYLFFAGLFEIAWAVGLKSTVGFSRLYPSLLTVSFMILSFYCLSYSLKDIPMGTAYAIWTGIGATGVALIGMLYLGEPTNILRILCIALIVIGIVGLKLCH